MGSDHIINVAMIFVAQALMAAGLGQISNQKLHRLSCRKEATFKANGTGFMVKASSSKLISTSHTPWLASCARTCIQTDDCKSMLFKRKPAMATDSNCQTLKVEKMSLASDDMENSIGWTYYEPLQQGTSRCQPSTCQSGYECVDTCNPNVTAQYTCIDVNECESNSCRNGGNCTNKVNSYSCTCEPGFTGTNCETDVNECESSPCLNGATCNNHIKSYSCTCAAGYNGTRCETDINECASSPCKNGATCSNNLNSYSCTCVAGYLGTNCETDINECESNPCKNGGTCNDLVNSHSCICIGGYTGPVCQTTYSSTINSPDYPSEYASSETKTWTLSVPSGRISLYFYDFNTESCCDKVELRDGSSETSTLFATLSGTDPKYKTYIASGNYVHVTFRTDGSVQRTGFMAYIGSF